MKRFALTRGGPTAIAHARRQLGRVDQINLDRAVLDDATTLVPEAVLRFLDAIHLASARSIAGDLRAIVTYDHRMADAAATVGVEVAAPS